MNITERIQAFNQGRDPALLSLKYRRMQADIFTFFRGNCHLFYEDWPTQTVLNEAPLLWVCGDLHLQNFGTYKAGNRELYFDINDFDDAALAPCTVDLARFVTSLILGFSTLGGKQMDAMFLCRRFLECYAQTLKDAKVGGLTPRSSEGLVEDLLNDSERLKRQAFLDDWTILDQNQRRLKIDLKRTLAISSAMQAQIAACLKDWAIQTAAPDFFKVLDSAFRVAGTGSLGLKRFVVLVEGKGSPQRNRLIDLKMARIPALQSYLSVFMLSALPKASKLNQIT